MKLPAVILRRLEWRLGLGARPLRVPRGMTRLDFEAALESLPFEVDAEELREFVEAEEPAAPAQTACPVFRERLRRLLWGLVRREPSMPVHLEQPLH
jgi:hypothetical protein